MDPDMILQCVDCGFSSSTFNITIVDVKEGAFTYAAQCPMCDSRKVNLIKGEKASGLKIYITVDGKLKISGKHVGSD